MGTRNETGAIRSAEMTFGPRQQAACSLRLERRVAYAGTGYKCDPFLRRRAAIGYTARKNAASQAAGARGGDFRTKRAGA